jgi:hypothetical protein
LAAIVPPFIDEKRRGENELRPKHGLFRSQKAELRKLPSARSILSSEFLIFLKYGQKLQCVVNRVL